MAPRPRLLLLASTLSVISLCLPRLEPTALAAGPDAEGEADAKEAARLYKVGNYEDAAKLFAKLSVEYPDKPIFELRLGQCFYYLRKPEPALLNLRNFMNHQKGIPADDRAEIDRWINEMEKLRAQERAQEEDPRVARARKLCTTEEVKQGVDLLAEVFTETKNPNLIFDRGRCYENSQLAEATKSFKEYLRVAKSLSADKTAYAKRYIAICQPEPKVDKEERLSPLKKLVLGKDLYAKYAPHPSPLGKGVTVNPDPEAILGETTLEFGVGLQNRSSSPVTVSFRKFPAYPMSPILSVTILGGSGWEMRPLLGPEVYDAIREPLYFEQVEIPANTELRIVASKNLDEFEYWGKTCAKLRWELDLEGLPAQGKLDLALPEMRSLHFAARWRWLWAVSKLIAEGADVNALDRHGRSPLESAVDGGDVQVVGLLLKGGAKPEPAFLGAANRGKLDVVRTLVEGGADVQIKDSERKTGIHWAAVNGNAEVVTYLAGKGVDVNAKDKWGRTALMDARDEKTRAALKEAAARYHAQSRDEIISQVTARVLYAPRYIDLDGQPRQSCELGYRQVTMVIDAKKTVCRYEPIVHPPYNSIQQRQLKDWRAELGQRIKRIRQHQSSEHMGGRHLDDYQDVRQLERILSDLTDGTFPVLTHVEETADWETFADKQVLDVLASHRFDNPYDYFKSGSNSSRVTVEFQRSNGGTLSLTYPELYAYRGPIPQIKAPFPEEVKPLLGSFRGRADRCVEEIAAKRIGPARSGVR